VPYSSCMLQGAAAPAGPYQADYFSGNLTFAASLLWMALQPVWWVIIQHLAAVLLSLLTTALLANPRAAPLLVKRPSTFQPRSSCRNPGAHFERPVLASA